MWGGTPILGNLHMEDSEFVSAWEARLLLCHWWSLIMVMMTMIMIQTGSSKLQSKGVDSAVSDMKKPYRIYDSTSFLQHLDTANPLDLFFRVLSLVLLGLWNMSWKGPSARFEEKTAQLHGGGATTCFPLWQVYFMIFMLQFANEYFDSMWA